MYIQISAISNIEAKKRFEFLEAVSGTMDAHLRYFKQVFPFFTPVLLLTIYIVSYNKLDKIFIFLQGYELLHQMEPYIHQVLILCISIVISISTNLTC